MDVYFNHTRQKVVVDISLLDTDCVSPIKEFHLFAGIGGGIYGGEPLVTNTVLESKLVNFVKEF